MIDIHSHILPEIDDGAQTVEESVAILKEMYSQGTTTVVATPHFYIHEEAEEDFLNKRQESYEKLIKATAGITDIPKIILGAEVYFASSLEDCDLSKLCIENTDYFLLELPYYNITDNLNRQIVSFINQCQKVPIFAHVERYLKFTSPDKIIDLMLYGVMGQVNSSSFGDKNGRKTALELIRSGFVQLIGSDSHNLDTRPPCLPYAKKFIDKKFGLGAFETMQSKAAAVLENADFSTVMSI